MDAAMMKVFQVKVRALARILKEYKIYKNEVEAYDLNIVSQDKKKQEFYQESKSAFEQVEKKLIEFYQNLNSYIVSIILFSYQMKQSYHRNKMLRPTIKSLSRASMKSRPFFLHHVDLISI
jgi:hypothetical protein